MAIDGQNMLDITVVHLIMKIIAPSGTFEFTKNSASVIMRSLPNQEFVRYVTSVISSTK
jgi:hypothetical protein